MVLMTDIILPEGVELTALAGEGEDEIMIANTTHVKESQGTGAAAELEAAEAELEAATEAGDVDAEDAGDDDADVDAADDAEAPEADKD